MRTGAVSFAFIRPHLLAQLLAYNGVQLIITDNYDKCVVLLIQLDNELQRNPEA